MKILLNVTENRVELSAFIRSKTYRAHGIVKFFVDTGSPKTFLSENDAKRLNIPHSKLETEEDQAIMGASRLSFGALKEINLSIIQPENKRANFDLEHFLVAKSISTMKYSNPESSIIGLDFLREHSLTLYCDVKNKIAYLEDTPLVSTVSNPQ